MDDVILVSFSGLGSNKKDLTACCIIIFLVRETIIEPIINRVKNSASTANCFPQRKAHVAGQIVSKSSM